MNRAQALEALRRRAPWDLLVIGGGIAGAGVALEAARAGTKVALVEARDFASGTSSRSSKLVHGGLRYIAQGQWALTRESVRERDALLRDAGGLVRPLRFLLPVRAGDRKGRRVLGLGLALYDALAGRRTRRWHDVQAMGWQAPMLDATGLQGGWSYEDAQTDDARLVLRVLAQARAFGALTLNHVAVQGLARPGGELQGLALQDGVSGERFELAARCVVNATGAWADGLRGAVGRPPALRPLRGSHLLLPSWRLPLAQALAFFHPDDRRPVFALPWEGATLVGTTDLDHREPLDQEPGITRAELHYLLKALHSQFPAQAFGERDVMATWSGVRPVVASGKSVDPSKEAREHLVVEEDGLITVTGGKLTTFRATAVQALRLAARRVPGLAAVRVDARLFEPVSPACEAVLRDLSPALRQRWMGRYGPAAQWLRALAQDGELDTVPGTSVAWAELRFACRCEAVVHLDDLMLRRTRLGLLLRDGGAACLPRVKPIAQQELGWSDVQWHEEAARYAQLMARCHGVPTQGPP
ncbi:MAG: glycerol-3-phosphate dehydrogenase/oxidase [Pseudomonadota bacterium]